jgi:hypothetical protein
MLSALMVVMIVVGLLLLPAFPITGCALCFAGFQLQKAAVFDEDVFAGALASLAGLGALATIVRGLWVQFMAPT